MNKKGVMKNAWKIARNGAAKFGGNAKEYFAEALKMAWAIAKKGYVFTLKNHTAKEWKNYGKHRLYINGEMEVLVNAWGNVQTRKVAFQGYYDFDKNCFVRESGKQNYREEIFEAMRMIKEGSVA
jgi:Streptococcus thermophilus bacteriophage Gp111 protein